MNYKKGYNQGYEEGLKKGLQLAMHKFTYAVDFAGCIRKKQHKIISSEILEEVKLVKTPKPICQFSQAWVGRCESTNILDNGQCEKHQDKCSCGELATNSCAHAGQFVCGRPLCDNCRCNH
jgi:hypothetical protein